MESKNEDKKKFYGNTWHDYCISHDPKEIEKIIREEYILSKNREIHLDVFDDDSENRIKTIIFIHGTAVYSRFYAELVYDLFIKGYRVIALDLPGHGLSGGKRGHFTMNDLTGAIHDVVSFALEKWTGHFFLMGSSLGGIITLYSVANDERIHAAICSNTAVCDGKSYKKLLNLKGIYKYLAPLVPFLAKIFPILRLSVWKYLDIDELIHDKTLLREMKPIIMADECISDKYSLKSLAAQIKSPLARPIQEITTPVMIINGSDDVLFSIEYMQEIFDMLENSPQKKLEIIGPNASHLILHEKREECVNKIHSWLSSLKLKENEN